MQTRALKRLHMHCVFLYGEGTGVCMTRAKTKLANNTTVRLTDELREKLEEYHRHKQEQRPYEFISMTDIIRSMIMKGIARDDD